MDDTQKRLGIIETALAEIKVFLTNLATNVATNVATKAELEQLRGEVREIKAVLPHLATKADLEAVKASVKVDIEAVKTDVANLHTAMIKWMVGTMLGGTAAAYSVARLFG